MRAVKMLGLAGTAALVCSAALAADLSPLKAPYFLTDTAGPGGWYLRGDIGVGAQKFKSYNFTQTNMANGGAWPTTWRIDQKDIKDATLIGVGIGYQWNDWLRFDITGEYRSDVKFKAVGSYFNGTDRSFDVYDGDHSAMVVLVNGYVDLGRWWCVTPFLGVGVGGAYHRTASLSDTALNTNGLGASAFGFANQDASNWSFAWAAHAGLSYTISPKLKLEFAYRYLSMGNAKTAEVLCGAGGCGTGTGPRAFYSLTDFSSHDFKMGVRWLLQPEVPTPSLQRRG
jgi:opacity protein-like surface antigen